MRRLKWRFVMSNGKVLTYRLGNPIVISAFCTTYPKHWVELL